MEYSVYDLIRILLKKWYVILLAACLLGGASVPLSHMSYQSAVENYERLSSETVPVILETGTTVAVYRCAYEVQTTTLSALFDCYVEELAEEREFDLIKEEDMAELLIQTIQPQVLLSATSEALVEAVQVELDIMEIPEPPTIDANKNVTPSSGGLTASEHLSVKVVDDTICATVSGLEQEPAKQLLEVYCQQFKEMNSNNLAAVTLEQESCEFECDPLRFTTTALLAQEVMREPPSPPGLVKTAGTAAAFGVVLGCFGVLLGTFIRDTYPSKKRTQKTGRNK